MPKDSARREIALDQTAGQSTSAYSDISMREGYKGWLDPEASTSVAPSDLGSEVAGMGTESPGSGRLDRGASLSVKSSDNCSWVVDTGVELSGEWVAEVDLSVESADTGSRVSDTGGCGAKFDQEASLSVEMSDMGSGVVDMEVGFSGQG